MIIDGAISRAEKNGDLTCDTSLDRLQIPSKQLREELRNHPELVYGIIELADGDPVDVAVTWIAFGALLMEPQPG